MVGLVQLETTKVRVCESMQNFITSNLCKKHKSLHMWPIWIWEISHEISHRNSQPNKIPQGARFFHIFELPSIVFNVFCWSDKKIPFLLRAPSSF